ncbi:hypothetical protein A9R05_41820 (plasmid) [Burkholderia sp. KK1]|nr:hypothetical protein A9R05_41820 [Burkholderia sp. KK1]
MPLWATEMLIDFEDRLDDGRAIRFEADEFEADDPGVGYAGAVTNWCACLKGTGFPVSLTEAEESRLTNKAWECWREAIAHDHGDFLDE